jgi:glycosyltransferase involved in cell wall biosynthesis
MFALSGFYYAPPIIGSMPTRPLGIIIPTYNRCVALLQCLAHLEKQTFKDFEVVIVDDGSSDGTTEKIAAYQASSPLSIRFASQANGGPAKARNLGISMLSSPLCLMLGDDIFASPSLVELHMHLHRNNPDVRVAALGLIRWSTSGQVVTPFMRWLEDANVQFSYPLLFAGATPNWGHFYTSNLSVKTELLRRFAFNEAFPYAAMEDIELAYRIQQGFGLDVRFLPEALAEHLHPTTFRQACRRMIRVGYSFGLFYELWPEQKPSEGTGWRKDIIHVLSRSPLLLKLSTAAVDLLTRFMCPNRFILYIFHSYMEIGKRSLRKTRAALTPLPG